jgi:hypothetical protein
MQGDMAPMKPSHHCRRWGWNVVRSGPLCSPHSRQHNVPTAVLCSPMVVETPRLVHGGNKAAGYKA